eukprot:1460187-Pyramimonas_sp.AAC.1
MSSHTVSCLAFAGAHLEGACQVPARNIPAEFEPADYRSSKSEPAAPRPRGPPIGAILAASAAVVHRSRRT